MDNCIFLEGIVYLMDIGMIGLYDVIFGMEKEVVICWFKIVLLIRFEVFKIGWVVLLGCLIIFDENIGKV